MIPYVWSSMILFLLMTLVSISNVAVAIVAKDETPSGEMLGKLMGGLISSFVSFTMFILGVVVLVTQ